MKAFVNSKISKAQLIASLKAHQLADNFIKGSCWTTESKGCHLGCSVHDFEENMNESDHSAYPRLFNLSERLAYLTDRLFEGLSIEESKTFSLRVTESIPVGCNTDNVIDKFLYWLLSGDTSPIANWNKTEYVKTVANLYKRKLAGDEPSIKEWKAAASAAAAASDAYAAASAAAYAASAVSAASASAATATAATASAASYAYAAADAYAASAAAAAAAAASAAAYAAASAASDAYAAADAYASAAAAYKTMTDKLIEIFRGEG